MKILHNGAMIYGLSTDTQIKVLKDLGVIYTRSAVNLQTWKGHDVDIEKFNAVGIKVVLDIKTSTQDPTHSFATNLTTYRDQVASVFKKYKPAFACCENEETNKNFHKVDIDAYLRELEVFSSVCAEFGVECADGGIGTQGLCYWIYKTKTDDDAQSWMASTFSPEMRAATLYPDKHIEAVTYLNWIDQLLNGFKGNKNLTHVNVHLYEPMNSVGDGISPFEGAYKVISDFISDRCGKKTMTNECGQHNDNTILVRKMLGNLRRAGFTHAIWYSGDGPSGPAIALNNSDGSLRPNGEAYKKKVAIQFSKQGVL